MVPGTPKTPDTSFNISRQEKTVVTPQVSPRDTITVSGRSSRPILSYQRGFCHEKLSPSLVIPSSCEEAKSLLRSSNKEVSSLKLPPRPPRRSLDLTATPVTSRVAMICHGCHGPLGEGAHVGSRAGKNTCTLQHHGSCPGNIQESDNWRSCPRFIPTCQPASFAGYLGLGFTQTLSESQFSNDMPHRVSNPAASTPALAGSNSAQADTRGVPQQPGQQLVNDPLWSERLRVRPDVNYDEGGSGAIDLTVVSPAQRRAEQQVQALRADNQAALGAVSKTTVSTVNNVGINIGNLRSDPRLRESVEQHIDRIREDVPALSSAPSAGPPPAHSRQTAMPAPMSHQSQPSYPSHTVENPTHGYPVQPNPRVSSYAAIDQAAVHFSTLSVQQPPNQPPVSTSGIYQPGPIGQYHQPHGGCCGQGPQVPGGVSQLPMHPSGGQHPSHVAAHGGTQHHEPLRSVHQSLGQGAMFHQQDLLQHQYAPNSGVAGQHLPVHHQYPGPQVQQCTERRDGPAKNISQQPFYSPQPLPQNLGHVNALHSQQGSHQTVGVQAYPQGQEQQSAEHYEILTDMYGRQVLVRSSAITSLNHHHSPPAGYTHPSHGPYQRQSPATPQCLSQPGHLNPTSFRPGQPTHHHQQSLPQHHVQTLPQHQLQAIPQHQQPQDVSGVSGYSQSRSQIEGIVNINDQGGAPRRYKLLDYAKRCPTKWAREAKPATMNLALYGYGALAELEAALLERGEVNKEVLGKVRHVKNTFEVCCVNSEAKDFVSYGWILARDYAWKVENKVEQGITNWQGMPVGVQTSDLVLAQCEYPRPSRTVSKPADDKNPKKLCTTYNHCATLDKCEYEVTNPDKTCQRRHECSYCRKYFNQGYKHQEVKCSKKRDGITSK